MEWRKVTEAYRGVIFRGGVTSARALHREINVADAARQISAAYIRKNTIVVCAWKNERNARALVNAFLSRFEVPRDKNSLAAEKGNSSPREERKRDRLFRAIYATEHVFALLRYLLFLFRSLFFSLCFSLFLLRFVFRTALVGGDHLYHPRRGAIAQNW